MTTEVSTITNIDLQASVEEELLWDPAILPASIGVSVTEGAVTLTGTVAQLSCRLAAVRAAKRVEGVRAIADEIVVNSTGIPGRSDHEVAEFVEHALQWNTVIPDSVHATLRNGVATLDGTVEWNYERRAAARVVEYISGVESVVNNISLKHMESAENIHHRIVGALRRHADIDADTVEVTSADGEVRLDGSVSSWAEREQVEAAAWTASGVSTVQNNLIIR